jgi:hypothetical protein
MGSTWLLVNTGCCSQSEAPTRGAKAESIRDPSSLTPVLDWTVSRISRSVGTTISAYTYDALDRLRQVTRSGWE